MSSEVISFMNMDLAMMAEAVNRRLLTVESKVQSQTSACVWCIHNGNVEPWECMWDLFETDDSEYFGLPRQCHSTIAPYLLIYLPVTDAL